MEVRKIMQETITSIAIQSRGKYELVYNKYSILNVTCLRSMRKERKNMVMLEYRRPCMLGLDDVAFITSCDWSRKHISGCPLRE